MSTYKSDPIVAEIRAIRAKQAARFENDPAAIIRHAQALQEAIRAEIRPVCRSSFGGSRLGSTCHGNTPELNACRGAADTFPRV